MALDSNQPILAMDSDGQHASSLIDELLEDRNRPDMMEAHGVSLKD